MAQVPNDTAKANLSDVLVCDAFNTLKFDDDDAEYSEFRQQLKVLAAKAHEPDQEPEIKRLLLRFTKDFNSNIKECNRNFIKKVILMVEEFGFQRFLQVDLKRFYDAISSEAKKEQALLHRYYSRQKLMNILQSPYRVEFNEIVRKRANEIKSSSVNKITMKVAMAQATSVMVSIHQYCLSKPAYVENLTAEEARHDKAYNEHFAGVIKFPNLDETAHPDYSNCNKKINNTYKSIEQSVSRNTKSAYGLVSAVLHSSAIQEKYNAGQGYIPNTVELPASWIFDKNTLELNVTDVAVELFMEKADQLAAEQQQNDTDQQEANTKTTRTRRSTKAEKKENKDRVFNDSNVAGGGGGGGGGGDVQSEKESYHDSDFGESVDSVDSVDSVAEFSDIDLRKMSLRIVNARLFALTTGITERKDGTVPFPPPGIDVQPCQTAQDMFTISFTTKRTIAKRHILVGEMVTATGSLITFQHENKLQKYSRFLSASKVHVMEKSVFGILLDDSKFSSMCCFQSGTEDAHKYCNFELDFTTGVYECTISVLTGDNVVVAVPSTCLYDGYERTRSLVNVINFIFSIECRLGTSFDDIECLKRLAEDQHSILTAINNSTSFSELVCKFYSPMLNSEILSSSGEWIKWRDDYVKFFLFCMLDYFLAMERNNVCLVDNFYKPNTVFAFADVPCPLNHLVFKSFMEKIQVNNLKDDSVTVDKYYHRQKLFCSYNLFLIGAHSERTVDNDFTCKIPESLRRRTVRNRTDNFVKMLRLSNAFLAAVGDGGDGVTTKERAFSSAYMFHCGRYSTHTRYSLLNNTSGHTATSGVDEASKIEVFPETVLLAEAAERKIIEIVATVEGADVQFKVVLPTADADADHEVADAVDGNGANAVVIMKSRKRSRSSRVVADSGNDSDEEYVEKDDDDESTGRKRSRKPSMKTPAAILSATVAKRRGRPPKQLLLLAAVIEAGTSSATETVNAPSAIETVSAPLAVETVSPASAVETAAGSAPSAVETAGAPSAIVTVSAPVAVETVSPASAVVETAAGGGAGAVDVDTDNLSIIVVSSHTSDSV